MYQLLQQQPNEARVAMSKRDILVVGLAGEPALHA
jgi:hypothetical protein